MSTPANDGTAPTLTAPAMFSLLGPAYAKKYGVEDDRLKEVLRRIAWKNHKNGALNPRAQFRKEVSMETIAASPLHRRQPRDLRLLGGGRRLGRRSPGAVPRTPTATPTSRSS